MDSLRQPQSDPLEMTGFRLELRAGAQIFEPSDASSPRTCARVISIDPALHLRNYPGDQRIPIGPASAIGQNRTASGQIALSTLAISRGFAWPQLRALAYDQWMSNTAPGPNSPPLSRTLSYTKWPNLFPEINKCWARGDIHELVSGCQASLELIKALECVSTQFRETAVSDRSSP